MLEFSWLPTVQSLATDIPLPTVEKLVDCLLAHDGSEPAAYDALRYQLEAIVHSERRYAQLHHLIDALKTGDVDAKTMGVALLSAAQMRQTTARSPITLMWTGPQTSLLPVRKHDQGLLQVIQSATHSLFIVTFAFYPYRELLDALESALGRGVDIHLLIEFPQANRSHNKVRNNIIRMLGLDLARRCHIYAWPLDSRPNNATIHAKVAVADDKMLYISSANLTHSAMQYNIELGVLIRDSAEPKQIRDHFHALISNGTFIKKSEAEIVAAVSR